MNTSALVAERRSFTLAASPLILPLVFSALAWGLLFYCLPPASQEFPLNDDWAFGRGALQFAAGKGIHYGGWASMPLLGQWLWSCPFIWILGPSFFALRVSTIFLSWLGLWAFYDLLRQEDWPADRAALAAGALAFHPLFFLLQGTFMTDVPALSLSLLALAFYVRAVRREQAVWMGVACVTALLAAITRQNTVTVSLVAAVLLGRAPSLRPRLGWWAGILLPAAAGLIAHFWFGHRTDVRAQRPELLPPAPLLQLPFVVLHFAGLTALPLLFLAPRVEKWRPFAWALGLMIAFAGYWFLYGVYLPYGGFFPYTENMLSPQGAFAGSRQSGGLMIAGNRPVLLETPSRVFLSLLGCVAGALLVVRASRFARRSPSASDGGKPIMGAAAWWTHPLLLFAVLQVPFLLIVPGIYDRYLLFLLPGALFLAAPPVDRREDRIDRRALVASWGVLAVFGVVSVALMHDWLSWNATRWRLGLRAVAQQHVNPLAIEGGVEWDGLWSLDVQDNRPHPPRTPWPVLPFTREWFPWIAGRYWLSFSDLSELHQRKDLNVLPWSVDTEPYSLWLARGGPRQFYLLEWRPKRAEPQKRPEQSFTR